MNTMDLMHIFFIFTVDFLSVVLVTGYPDPPKDIRIHVIGSTANISWTIPTNIQKNTEWSRIKISTSTGGDIVLNSIKAKTYKYIDIPVSKSSFEINNLEMCSEYIVRIKFVKLKTKFTSKKFWMTNTTSTFTADFNEDVTLLWTTGIIDFFTIKTPSSVVIYDVQGGGITISGKMEKYTVNSEPNDIKTIKITVLHVNGTDAGLYTAEDNNKNVNGCCFLVVTGKPKKPTLSFRPEHPFIDDNITFTCNSTVQRWPEGYGTAHLLYQFFGNPRGESDRNTLIISKLTIRDKGINISCQATDDLGKVSYKSDAVTIDPYYIRLLLGKQQCIGTDKIYWENDGLNDDASIFNKFCNYDVDGGGWIVIQRRQDNFTDFYRTWSDYKNGFGSLNGSFWLGNDNIHQLTSSGRYELRVDLSDWEGGTWYAVYKKFKVENEFLKYKLTVGNYSGTAGDSLKYHNTYKFSTKDQDNDNDNRDCAKQADGGWWYKNCQQSNLNGIYKHGASNHWNVVSWDGTKGSHYSLKFARMMIRRY